MSPSPKQPFNPTRLARLLKRLRKKHKLSLSAVARASGISRKTLARVEAGGWAPVRPGGRTAMRLAKLLLPADRVQEILADQTRMSHAYAQQIRAPAHIFDLMDLLPDQYPAFLFHHAPEPFATEWREHYAADYTGSLFQLVLRPPRNLAARLRAWRLQHDLTLVETADLLRLSKKQLIFFEQGRGRPKPRTAYRILRLITIPISEDAVPRRRRARARGGVGAGAEKQKDERQEFLDWVKLLLALPPPAPPLGDDADGLDLLRWAWFAYEGSSRELAEDLEISTSHLTRLLRGDASPSRALRERIAGLADTLPP